MKTVKTIFVTVAISLMSTNVMAAPGVREVRNKVLEADKTAINRETIKALKGTTDAQAVSRGSQLLSDISGGLANRADLKEVILRRNISYESASGVHEVKTGDIVKRLLKIDQSVKEIKESMRDLTPGAKAHLEALDEAVSIGAQFLAMAARTSDRTELVSAMTPGKKNQLRLFYKQLAILGDIGTMDTADLKAHTKIMKEAVKYYSPKINGDLAFTTALNESVGRDQEKFNKKMKDILDCI